MIEDFWSEIGKETRPVVIYGTGDASERLFALLKERGIRTSAFVSSPEFLRSRSFLGYKVMSLERAKEIFSDDIVLLMGFGSHKMEVMDHIVSLSMENDLYMPDLMVNDQGLPTTRETLGRERERIEWAYSLLNDDVSRLVFSSSLEHRLTGRIEQILKINSREEDNWDLLKLGEDEVMVDGGAYDGDTVSLFMSKAASWKRVYAVEPSGRAFNKLKEKYSGRDDIVLINGALSDKSGAAHLLNGHGRGNRVVEGEGTALCSIDSILNGEKATFLKFDIEGEEEKGIMGAAETIRRHKPKILLSAYHRFDDFWRLLEVVWSIRQDYRVYMRKSPSLPLWDVQYYLV